MAKRAISIGMKTYILSGYLFGTPAPLLEEYEVLMKPVRPREVLEALERAIGRPDNAGRTNR